MTAQKPQYNRNYAFTLIELLVVIALTAILLTLVFGPLINTLNLTSRASTQIESQQTGRDVLRRMETELSGPVFVYDNVFQGPGDPSGYGNVGDPDGRVNIWMYGQNPAVPYVYNPIAGPPVVVPVRFGMIEYVQPAGQAESSGSGPVDPTTGKPDPGANAPGNVSLPLVRGRTITRVFPGLQNNTSGATSATQDGVTLTGQPVDAQGAFHGYANRYDDASDVNPKQDNRVTLYRADVQPYIVDPGTGNYVPNIALFHTVNAQGGRGQSTTGTIILDDPNFFYDTTPVPAAYVRVGAPGVDIAGRASVPMWECWKAVSQPLLPLNKGDAIEVRRDDYHKIMYVGGVPIVRPLITFTPQYVENDPGIPASVEATASETPYTAATTFRSQYGAWARPFRILVYRSPDGLQDPLTYQDAMGNPAYYEMDDRNSGILYQGKGGNVGPVLDQYGAWTNKPDFAFTPDYDKGTINFAFPHTVYDRANDSTHSPLPMYYNATTVNSQIDIQSNGEPLTGRRYLWLRYFDGTNTLNPGTVKSPLNEFYMQLDNPIKTPPTQPNVRIVPGSERVFGPDQLPGAHYGYRTLYTRVSANAGQIGPNQYKILYENAANANYVNNVNDPRVQTGYVEFDSQPDVDPYRINSNGVGSANLDPIDDLPISHMKMISGQMQLVPPTYRTHSLPEKKWMPDPAAPTDTTKGTVVAADPMEVSYSFQMNRPSDVVKIDYLTRSILNVTMEMRLYDTRSARPQTTQLTSKVSVRNLQR